jgi:Xaa-Pro aminopeptidase/Xaa-Pro dipeptidase
MTRDDDRVGRLRDALAANRLDAVVCTLRANVLLVSGYWPVIGTAIAVATREGAIGVLAPLDEMRCADDSWADAVRPFNAGPLRAGTIIDTMRQPLAALMASVGVRSGSPAAIGFEAGPAFDPAGYASGFLYGASLDGLLRAACPGAVLQDATACLAELRASLTEREIALVCRACGIAGRAFAHAAALLREGLTEFEIASRLRGALADGSGERCDGFAYCMSGPNAARADAAFQQSTSRRVGRGDCVLLHCNSYCEGFWTDITRTLWVGEPSAEQRAMHAAVLEAAERAAAAIRPGVRASAVDRAAREVMIVRGLGEAFTHPTGHGVGFAAIDHNALPRIHADADDELRPGMVFNIEPAAYIPGVCGVRHCDMFLVTGSGGRCLSAIAG